MWFTVSSLSTHNLRLLFCCVQSIFAPFRIIIIIIMIIIIIIIIYSLEIFTSALVNGLSREIEGLQVYSGLQDSSQYSGRL